MITKTKTTMPACAFALAAATLFAGPASAQNIMGPTKIISVTSTIPGGSNTYTLNQINDGITSDVTPYNGFQGAQNTTGIITFTLDQDYDLESAHLWNDINVKAEGVGKYSWKFYNAAGNLVGETPAQPALLSTVVGQTPAHVTPLTVSNVRKVEMIVHTIQNKPNTYSLRVEIREVAFDGKPTPKKPIVPGEHYQCYRIIEAPTLAPENIVVADQFGKSEIVLGRPAMLCNPSVKVHNGKTYAVLNQKVHQVCYNIVKQNDSQPTRKVRTGNQFTTADMAVGGRQMFCVPSYKTLLSGKEFPIDSAE